MANQELLTEVQKLRSDIETLKSNVFSNANQFKTHSVDILFLKANVVNKGDVRNPVKFLREDRTWATIGGREVDGGFANSVYLVSQLIDGGGA